MPLNTIDRKFEYADLEKRLKHYFTDSAPIMVDIVIEIGAVSVSSKGQTVRVALRDDLDVKVNVHRIIELCESSLYPKMIHITKESKTKVFTTEEKKQLVIQGKTLEQILAMENFKVSKKESFTIIRLCSSDNSVIFRIDETGNRVKARMLVPIRSVVKKIQELNPTDLYEFIIANGTLETHEISQ